ncbi:hypothetical protein LXL04_003157 [Taraxacum kok-saghyz]
MYMNVLEVSEADFFKGITKFRNKLSVWKARALSIGGRHTLVNNVLGSLGSYWFSSFIAPKTVINQLEAIRRNFFSGSTEDTKVIPSEDGGLGINSLKHLNEALISKWVWRFHTESEAIWVKILKSIHGKDCTNNCQNKALKSSNWSSLLNLQEKMKTKDLDIRQYLKIKCGNGMDTRFWIDPWITFKPLKDQFPRLLAIEADKFVYVSGRIGGDTRNWNWTREPSRGCTRDNLEELEKMTESVNLTNEKDEWIITDAPNQTYTVSWFKNHIQQKESSQSSFRNIWSTWLPKRNNILAWRILRGRMPVKLNLSNMGVDLNDVLCPICQDHTEDINHVFLKFHWAESLWTQMSQWWNMPLPTFDAIHNIFDWIDKCKEKEIFRRIMTTIVVGVLSTIWIHRNGVTFEKKKMSTEVAFIKMQEETLSWISNRNSYILENPRTHKPLTFSKNRLREAKNRSNTSPFLKKKIVFSEIFFATGLVFERFLAPRSRFFEKVNGLGVLGEASWMHLGFKDLNQESEYGIFENPRTPKPLTFSKNRLRGDKNRSNTCQVAVLFLL